MDFKILGQFVSSLVHDSALENFIWKDLRREGKAGPLYLSYPKCKLDF